MIFEDIILKCNPNNLGGVKKFYINSYEEVYPFITKKVGRDIYFNGFVENVGYAEYKTIPETSTFNCTGMKGDNKLFYFKTDISLTFPSLDKSVLDRLLKILDNDSSVILELNNGERYFLGYHHPVHVESINISTGSSLEDGSIINISFSVSEKNAPYRINDGK